MCKASKGTDIKDRYNYVVFMSLYQNAGQTGLILVNSSTNVANFEQLETKLTMAVVFTKGDKNRLNSENCSCHSEIFFLSSAI
jgi:hypothetical protein